MRRCLRSAVGFLESSVLVSRSRDEVERSLLGEGRARLMFSSYAGDSCLQYESGTNRRVELQIVNLLHLQEKEKASDLLPSLVNIENYEYVLDYCARIPDALFAMETLRLMEKQSVEINRRCWMHVLRALCRGGYLKEAISLLCSMGESYTTVIPMYNVYLSACVRSKNFCQANSCLQLMDAQLMGKREGTYVQLLKLAVLQNNLSLVHGIWMEYYKSYMPSFTFLHKYIWSLWKLGDLGSAYCALKQMVTLATQGTADSELSGSGIPKSGLDIPIPLKNESASKTLTVPTIQEDSLSVISLDIKCASSLGIRVRKILTSSFNGLLHACGNSGNCDLAEQLFQQMCEIGLKPSSKTYDGVIRAVLPKKNIEYARKMFDEMEKRNIKPCNATLVGLSIGYSNILDLDSAELFLNKISRRSNKLVYPFNALLSACHKLDKLEHALHCFSRMKHMNIKPDLKTYELLFSLFCAVNAPYEKGNLDSQQALAKRVTYIEVDMQKNGLEHNSLTLENLIRGLGSEGMIEDLLRYMDKAASMFTDAYPGTTTCNVVLHSLLEARDNQRAVTVFKWMRTCDVQPDSETYNIMVDCCSIPNCMRTATALISLMLRSGFSPSICTYTVLMKILLNMGNFGETVRLLDHILGEGLEVDVLLFNTVLKEASIKGYLDMVELIVEIMHQEKIQPDPITCSLVFSTYIECELYDTALEALEVLSMRMISEDDDSLCKMRTLYEYLVHSEDPEVESWIINIFNVANEHLAAALLNLRWCVINGHGISWLPNESNWMKRLSGAHSSWRRMLFQNSD